jgi:DNA-binding MarR family transcriptional regulator
MQLLPHTNNRDCVSSCAKEVLDAVPGLLWYVRLHMRKHRKGLSVPQFRALLKVQNHPAASLSMVAEHLGASMPTASRTVDTLVAKGLLSRESSSEDRRQVRLQLTADGKAIVCAARRATQAQMEAQFAHLSPAERSTVRDGMHILKQLIESMGYSGVGLGVDVHADPDREENAQAGGEPGRPAHSSSGNNHRR